MSTLKTWVSENSTLVYFLIAQALAIGTVGVSVIAYMVRLETRVFTMETRGASFTVQRMDRIDEKLTVLEQISKTNGDLINRIVAIMTRELGKNPSGK